MLAEYDVVNSMNLLISVMSLPTPSSKWFGESIDERRGETNENQ